MITRSNPAGLVKPKNAYVQCVKVVGKGYLFISGQLPLDEQGELVGRGDIERQTQKVLENLSIALKGFNIPMGNVVKNTIFVKDMSCLPVVNKMRKRYWKTGFPASTMVEVNAFAHPDALIEIESVAVL